MYPTLSDILRDLFGWAPILPIQTFGLFLMFSFVAAYLVMQLELKHKEKAGLLTSSFENIASYTPPTTVNYVINAIIGFILGFKLILIVTDYTAFAKNPQVFLLSSMGNILTGLIGAAIGIGILFWDKKKNESKPITMMSLEVHPHERMGMFTGWAAIGGLLGAKVFHNLENLQEFKEDWVEALFSFSGLTFYGGLIVGAAGVLYAARKIKMPLLPLMDAAAPALILAYGVGRMGCQLSGDGDWGIENMAPKPEWLSMFPDWVWSYTYPHNVINAGLPIPGCYTDHCSALPIPVYPTPLYETIMALGIFGILMLLRKYISKPGVLFGIYLVFNGIERFLIEQIRVNNKMSFAGLEFTQAEMIATFMIIGGLAMALWLMNKKPEAKQEINTSPSDHENS